MESNNRSNLIRDFLLDFLRDRDFDVRTDFRSDGTRRVRIVSRTNHRR